MENEEGTTCVAASRRPLSSGRERRPVQSVPVESVGAGYAIFFLFAAVGASYWGKPLQTGNLSSRWRAAAETETGGTDYEKRWVDIMEMEVVSEKAIFKRVVVQQCQSTSAEPTCCPTGRDSPNFRKIQRARVL
jgi:hypothetical protein